MTPPPAFHVLVTGASGFLGWNLLRQRPRDWRLTGTSCAHPLDPQPGCNLRQVDLTRFDDVKRLFQERRPDALLHAAAMADPNRCQLEAAASRRINLEASVNLAGLCADAGIPILFVSTDLVFDGHHAPYAEDAAPNPVNRYGEQKALAEQEMRARCPTLAVARLPLMFGEAGPVAKSFLQPLAASLRAGTPVKLFADEFRTPVSGRSAAQGLYLLLRALAGQPGLFHLGGQDRVSRHELGLLLAEQLGLGTGPLVASRQAEVTMPARRPPDVSLLSSRAHALGWAPPRLRDDLAAELPRLAETCGH